jgi:hypothetical protein
VHLLYGIIHAGIASNEAGMNQLGAVERRRRNLRIVLFAIILGTLPLYCLGFLLWGTAPRQNARTPTPLTSTVLATLRGTNTLSPSLTPFQFPTQNVPTVIMPTLVQFPTNIQVPTFAFPTPTNFVFPTLTIAPTLTLIPTDMPPAPTATFLPTFTETPIVTDTSIPILTDTPTPTPTETPTETLIPP